VEIIARDASGRPLDGLVLSARLERPVEAVPPHVLHLSPQGDGRYSAAFMAQRPGQWDLKATLADEHGHRYALVERIFIP
jgi:nitrogen fixation protein FixH